MLKVELRKLAMVALAISVGFMVACSSSSSTDEALTHPGDNYMGTLRFDVDPQASTVDVTPVASPWSATKVPGDGSGNIPNVTLTTSGPAFTGGNTMDFDLTLQWGSATSELTNVRIGANVSTNMNVQITNGDRCGATDFATCLGGGTDPAITFVSDIPTEGAEQATICDQAGTTCETSDLNAIFQGCGSVTTHWTLFEAGGTGYTFWADLYGDEWDTTDLTADPRYDETTASMYLRVYNMDPADSTYPAENALTNSVKAGEWFYVHFYLDQPGNNKANPAPPTDTVNGPRRVEDAPNRAAVCSTCNYWYIGTFLPWQLRFDPAIIEINANDGSLPGNGLLKFWSQGLAGTKLQVINDWNGLADGHNMNASAFTSSNAQGMFVQISDAFQGTSTPLFYPSTGNGAVGNGADGLANADWDVGSVSLRAKVGTPAGTGSYIKMSYDSHSFVNAYTTEYSTYFTGDDPPSMVPRSLNWPDWCEKMPGGVCGGLFAGQYNSDRTYVCVVP